MPTQASTHEMAASLSHCAEHVHPQKTFLFHTHCSDLCDRRVESWAIVIDSCFKHRTAIHFVGLCTTDKRGGTFVANAEHILGHPVAKRNKNLTLSAKFSILSWPSESYILL